MNFGQALEILKREPENVPGHFPIRLARTGWNGPNQYISIQNPDDNSANTLPYIYIITEQGDRVPWLASQTDMLAEDWAIV